MKREIKPNPHRTTDLQVDFDRALAFPFPLLLLLRTGVTRAALGLSDFREVGGGGGEGGEGGEGGGRRGRRGKTASGDDDDGGGG